MVVILLACVEDDTGAEPVAVDVTEHGAVSCDDDRSSVVFDREELPGASDGMAAYMYRYQFGAAGIVAADFDDNGWVDLFFPEVGPDRLFLNGEGGLMESELPVDDDVATGGVAGDVDGDGDLDLYVTVFGGPNRLLAWNDGFSAVESGAEGGGYHAAGAAMADLDSDGDLDLLALNHRDDEALGEGLLAGDMPPGHPSELWFNDGSGHSTAADIGEALSGEGTYPFAGGFHDLDGDGDDDLYAVNDFGHEASPNVALVNDAGELSPVAGLDVALYGMGLGANDLDGDGIVDLAMSSWGELLLLESQSGWANTAAARGLYPVGDDRLLAWGLDLADLDNDGDLDLPVNFGFLMMPEDFAEELEETRALVNPESQRDALYLNEGGSFTEVSETWGVADDGIGRGVLAVDLDRDGTLDLVKRELDGAPIVYTSRCVREAWLVVDLRWSNPNTRAVGARVEVDGQYRWVRAGGTSFASAGPAEVHFGLGERTEAEVRVTWPDGEESVATVATRQRVTVSR